LEENFFQDDTPKSERRLKVFREMGGMEELNLYKKTSWNGEDDVSEKSGDTGLTSEEVKEQSTKSWGYNSDGDCEGFELSKEDKYEGNLLQHCSFYFSK
jgi:hypothetical protein